MQHRQLIQLLTRAEAACRAWDKQQSLSESLLFSMANIAAQQTASAQQRFKFDIDTSRLLYKQAQSFQQALEKLAATVDAMADIVGDLDMLKNEAEKHVIRTMPEMVSAQSKPTVPSTEALIQIAAVRPHEVYQYIADLHHTCEKELQYKQAWMDVLPERASTLEQLDDLRERWQAQPHFKPHLVAEISERIKLYKQTHRVLTSTD